MVRLAPLCPGHNDLKITPTQHSKPNFFFFMPGEGGEGLRWQSNGQLKAADPGLMKSQENLKKMSDSCESMPWYL